MKRTENKHNSLYYIIYSDKMAYKLIDDGFKLVKIMKDRDYAGRKIYFFTKSPELVYKVKQYGAQLREERLKQNEQPFKNCPSY